MVGRAMIIYSFKVKAKDSQYRAIDEAIRTSQFIQNKCLRYWMDNRGVSKYDLNKLCAVLAAEFPNAYELNSMARQSAAERAWSAIGRFYDNCKKQIKGKKGYPQFKKHCRSVEYKTSGWKLSQQWKAITFSDKKGIGTLKLKGTYDLNYYDIKQIKRVRLVRRAVCVACAERIGYYAQFAIDAKVRIEVEPTGQATGIDLGLKYFLADNKGNVEAAPQFYRKAEKQLNRANRQKSKKFRKGAKPQSKNYHKARNRYARKHLRVSRQHLISRKSKVESRK
jgi:putative transposase